MISYLLKNRGLHKRTEDYLNSIVFRAANLVHCQCGSEVVESNSNL